MFKQDFAFKVCDTIKILKIKTSNKELETAQKNTEYEFSVFAINGNLLTFAGFEPIDVSYDAFEFEFVKDDWYYSHVVGKGRVA